MDEDSSINDLKDGRSNMVSFVIWGSWNIVAPTCHRTTLLHRLRGRYKGVMGEEGSQEHRQSSRWESGKLGYYIGGGWDEKKPKSGSTNTTGLTWGRLEKAGIQLKSHPIGLHSHHPLTRLTQLHTAPARCVILSRWNAADTEIIIVLVTLWGCNGVKVYDTLSVQIKYKLSV